MSEADWERFNWYARRVKSFCYTRDPDSLDIAMHVYFRIAQLRRQPLLPSLRHLKCPHICQDDFLISSICLFLTPSLKVLDFEKITGVEDKLIGTFLHTLLCEGARIEKIVLVGEGLTKDTLGYLGRCMNLKILVLSGMGRFIDLEIVRSLGRIPGLEELELDLEESGLLSVTESDVVASSLSPSGTWRSGEAEFGYRELTSLGFIAPLSFIKTFVMRIGTTQLQRINFESSVEGEVDRKDLLVCIVRRWKNTLTYVRMVHNRDDTSDDDIVPPTITMDTISPLLRIPQLTHLEVDGYSLELGDHNVEEMANAWPRIHTLHLPYMLTGTPRPSVISLQTLSKRCPELRCLTIPLDASTFTRLLDTRVSLHKLQVLTVASPDVPWELRLVMPLARVIDRLFPFLTKVRAHSEDRETEEGRWQQVDQMVKMYQSVRREAMEIYRQSSIDIVLPTLSNFPL